MGIGWSLRLSRTSANGAELFFFFFFRLGCRDLTQRSRWATKSPLAVGPATHNLHSEIRVCNIIALTLFLLGDYNARLVRAACRFYLLSLLRELVDEASRLALSRQTRARTGSWHTSRAVQGS